MTDAAASTADLRFSCNICGRACRARIDELGREVPSCRHCGSTPRFRGIVHVLSVELFGQSLPLPEFPERKDLTGIGMSDWDGYGRALAQKLDYTNTYYHQEPRLDVTKAAPELEGTLDFVISSEVFEHVPPPVSVAFRNVRKLLKPSGVLVLSVPYGPQPRTQEHFPNLYRWRLEEVGARTRLVNLTRSGHREVFDDLVFHGGPGATLEMRRFGKGGLVDELRDAGFAAPRIYPPTLDHGVYWGNDSGLPMAVRTA